VDIAQYVSHILQIYYNEVDLTFPFPTLIEHSMYFVLGQRLPLPGEQPQYSRFGVPALKRAGVEQRPIIRLAPDPLD